MYSESVSINLSVKAAKGDRVLLILGFPHIIILIKGVKRMVNINETNSISRG